MRKISETSYIQGIIDGHDLAAKMDIDNQLDGLIKENKDKIGNEEVVKELEKVKEMVVKSVFNITK